MMVIKGKLGSLTKNVLLKAALDEESIPGKKIRVSVLAFEAVCRDALIPFTPGEKAMLNWALDQKTKKLGVRA